MKALHLCISLIYLICSNIRGLRDVSITVLLRIQYQISNSCSSIHTSDRRRRYRRQNSLTDLHEAVVHNCLQSVQHAVETGVPINLVDHALQTALYYACQRGHTRLVEYLLDQGARHDLLDLNQTSPLWIAAKEGHAAIVLMLLENGADPNHRAHDDTTALYQSSYEGHVRCVYHLIKHKACVHYAKNSGASPLFVAARNGHHRIVKHLLRHGADPDQAQEDLRSPLHTALLYNRVKCVRLLLRRTNVDRLIEQTDIYGWTCLHFLAKKGNRKSARVFFHHLSKHGKQLDLLSRKDCFGNTALHIAVFNRKMNFAQYLIQKKSDVDQSNAFGWTCHTLLPTCGQKFDREERSPKLYFENLLSSHCIQYTSEEKLICTEIEAYVQELVSYIGKLNPLFCNQVIRSGSYYEHTRVGEPDEFDYMINLTEIEHLCRFVETDDDPCGYGRLYPIDTREACERLFQYLDPTTHCVSADKIRKQFYQLLTSARAYVIRKEISVKFKHLKFEWTSGDKRCGTAVHAEWYGQQYSRLAIKVDVVPCLTVFAWPRAANIECPLSKSEFQVIARSPNVNETYLWRISMSRIESLHLNSCSLEQVNAYLILKSLRVLFPFTTRIGSTTYTADELITSYMFKNEFLFERDRCPQAYQWNEKNLIHRILAILKRLHKHVLVGTIQSFYIRNYNVIDVHDHQQLRSFEIKYVRTLLSHLKEKIETTKSKSLRRNTIAGVQPVTRKHKLTLRHRAFSSHV